MGMRQKLWGGEDTKTPSVKHFYTFCVFTAVSERIFAY